MAIVLYTDMSSCELLMVLMSDLPRFRQTIGSAEAKLAPATTISGHAKHEVKLGKIASFIAGMVPNKSLWRVAAKFQGILAAY